MSMDSILNELDALVVQALEEIGSAGDENSLRELEVKYLGKKGSLTAMLRSMGKIPKDQRPVFGKKVNEAKAKVADALQVRRTELKDADIRRELEDEEFDPTLPGLELPSRRGSFHPVSIVQAEVERIFEQMGFRILDYGEAESDWYNFEALNIPKDHPARDMQDTIWLKDGGLLRTHTSAGQVRAMQEYGAPLRAVFPGKVYRYERTDASHEHTFHQVEGLMIDRNISTANLIAVMKELLSAIFGYEVTVRLRPGYFPFVEPGFELDIQCMACGGEGCPVCKYSGWVELLPCGLVHPNVLRSGGLDPEEWTGWAFGLGLSRLAMMKYKITHITHFMGGDLRFFAQFGEPV